MAEALLQVLEALEAGDLAAVQALTAEDPGLLNAPDAGGVSNTGTDRITRSKYGAIEST